MPYISAYARNGLTLSGLPSTLDELLKSGFLPKGKFIEIGLHAPYHAFQLYEPSDLEYLSESTSRSAFAAYSTLIPLASSVTGVSTDAGTYFALIRQALKEILFEPLRLDKLTARLANEWELTPCRSYIITPIATLATQDFVFALNEAGVTDISIDDSWNTDSAAEFGQISDAGHPRNRKLAITGYSGRFPDAQSTDEFWNLLRQGLDVHSEVPIQRWDIKTHVDETLKTKNTSSTPYGCWLKDPGFFDAKFFNMSPREALQVDPAQRLALLTTYEAIENSGFVAGTTPSTQRDRVGVFYGTTSNDWGETNSSQDIDT
jgi:hypothetical protein